MKKANQFSSGLVLAGMLWGFSVLTGLVVLMRYDSSPGARGMSPEHWPQDSALSASSERPLLIMFAHPRCACSRASIEELARIMSHCAGRADARVVFFAPQGYDREWIESDLMVSAERIPGVTLWMDLDGVEAQRFGAATSGHTLLYSNDGRLLFSGGITPSRGHVGDNVGRSAIVSYITGRTPLVAGARDCRQCAVYGCAILDGGA